MNAFNSIYLHLDVFRDKVDALVEEYRENDKRNKDTYNDAHYQARHKELVERYRSKIQKEREKTQDTINTDVWLIQNTLDKWISAPMPESKINMLYLVMQSGLKLNKVEFEVLQESIGNNYFGNRLLSELAKRDGIRIKSNPGIETYERLLKDCLTSADTFLNGFYGSNPAMELVPNNVSRHIVTAAAVGAPLKDSCALHRAAAFWDGSSTPCPKTKISAEDKEIIQKVYSGCGDDEAKRERTKELILENPYLRDTLALTQYKEFIPEE